MVSTLHLLAPDLPTGTAKQVGYLVDRLAAAGRSQHICSLEHNQVCKDRLERFLPPGDYCRQSLRFDPTIVVRCARKIRESKPDVVHCWGTHRPLHVQLALRLAQVNDVVWSIRSDAEASSLRGNHAKRTLVTNADHLTNTLRPHQNAVRTVPNAVVVPTTPRIVSPLHRELQLATDSVFIVAMGDMRRKKKWRDVTWAFDLLRVIHPQAHLLVLGEGEFESELRAFVRPAASASSVHFMGFRDDVAAILRQACCFWQMSEDEGCSNALLEALAIGLPIVASDTAGHREVLQNGKFGSLVSLGDCAEMARRTNVLMGQGWSADQSRQASRYVTDRFSLDAMVEGYASIYDAIKRERAAA